MSGATTQIEIARLGGLQATLTSIEKTGSALGGAVASGAAGALLGAKACVYGISVVKEHSERPRPHLRWNRLQRGLIHTYAGMLAFATSACAKSENYRAVKTKA